ncbi:hypothetical protein [Nocardioides sambongensis]|uniref:hypothetical protein n=1 Tax=Nocardioides sambongensis TaxID=2589074 RepID=UPI0011262268|nr:hypothetical protein [Nocardioides sambongensis]
MHLSVRRPPGFFFARVLLGVSVLSGALLIVSVVASVMSSDPVFREIANRSRDVGVVDASESLLLINAAPDVLLGTVTLVTGWLLLVVVVDIQRGMPFESHAPRRLRWASYVVVVGVIGHALLSAWADTALLAEVGRHGEGFLAYAARHLFDTSAWWLVAALLSVFAAAFGAGRRLAEDADGLI